MRHDTDELFKPYLEKIDDIEKGVVELEQTAILLDQYSRRLGTHID